MNCAADVLRDRRAQDLDLACIRIDFDVYTNSGEGVAHCADCPCIDGGCARNRSASSRQARRKLLEWHRRGAIGAGFEKSVFKLDFVRLLFPKLRNAFL